MSNAHRDDNYLPCDRYQLHLPDPDGFARFQDAESGQWYFAWYALDEVVLRSEGYVSEEGRDQGIDAVRRYKDDEASYRVQRYPDGAWALELLAANHKEIARSCRYATEQEARMRLPGALEARIGMATAAPDDAGRDDDYLACREYEHHAPVAGHPGFTAFEKDGLFYFARIDHEGEVLLRSEGYRSADARRQGMESVSRNQGERGRYKIEEVRDYVFLVLTAPNYKEIARSCPLTEEAAMALINRLTGTTGVGEAMIASGMPAATIPGITAAPRVPSAALDMPDDEPIRTPGASDLRGAVPPLTRSSEGGGNRQTWWVLPLALLIALFLIWKACG